MRTHFAQICMAALLSCVPVAFALRCLRGGFASPRVLAGQARLAEDVALHRANDVVARGAGAQAELHVDRVEREDVLVHPGGRARAAPAQPPRPKAQAMS